MEHTVYLPDETVTAGSAREALRLAREGGASYVSTDQGGERRLSWTPASERRQTGLLIQLANEEQAAEEAATAARAIADFVERDVREAAGPLERRTFVLSALLPAGLTQAQLDHLLGTLVVQLEEPRVGADEDGNDEECPSFDVRSATFGEAEWNALHDSAVIGLEGGEPADLYDGVFAALVELKHGDE